MSAFRSIYPCLIKEMTLCGINSLKDGQFSSLKDYRFYFCTVGQKRFFGTNQSTGHNFKPILMFLKKIKANKILHGSVVVNFKNRDNSLKVISSGIS